MNAKYVVFKIVKGVVAVVLFGSLAGFGTMFLWNWLVPSLFGGHLITFCQAIGLIVLSKILFGGFGGRGKHCGGGNHRMKDRWKQKMQERMANMTEEEKEKWKSRCGQRINTLHP